MGSVNIGLANGGLGGTSQTADGVVGMVLTGGIDGGGYVLGTPIMITSYAGLATNGITDDGNEFALRQVREFYDHAGDGAILYLLLVTNSMTVADICDNGDDEGAVKLLEYAKGKIRLLGVMTDDSAIDTPTITDALNADVATAKVNMKVTAAAYFAKHQPFRCIIGGTSYSGVAADLADQTADSNNSVAILIGDTKAGETACLGIALGRAAAIPVQRKISRVRNGALATTSAYVGDIAVGATGSDTDVIASLGYITLMVYANTTGYFFSGDPMCTSTTDDYCMLARGRVIDKAHILTYTTFLQTVDDEIKVNDDGTLDTGFCKTLEQNIVNQITATMGAKGEISSVRAYIDPSQNILSTNTLNVVVRIIPVGYATDIEVSLGFENPNV